MTTETVQRNGLEMAQYRSTLMTHRLRMEAVEHMMSQASQVLQNPPNGQKPATSAAAFHGITSTATSRSDRARDTMKMLVPEVTDGGAHRKVPKERPDDEQRQDAARQGSVRRALMAVSCFLFNSSSFSFSSCVSFCSSRVSSSSAFWSILLP
ncbi:hypothetical protein EYF80_020375 [Liparis tanakae]|uniref:Uncharacterized protein n=1 Tax=Liparis tanakae TaxID=230148 RepID=A0A4Z2HWJ5_9TELE|nr:hypothetical protein EYF80_020375 [Liparis tanakae]